jgi:hypothetical protein
MPLASIAFPAGVVAAEKERSKLKTGILCSIVSRVPSYFRSAVRKQSVIVGDDAETGAPGFPRPVIPF